MSAVQDAQEIGKTQSIKYLFRFFCNNLYLGQWQLAKSSLQQLYVEQSTTSFPITDILKDVATYPFNRSLPSPSVSTPNLLAWLCVLECNKLSSGQTQYDTEQIDKELIEFRFLLIETCSNITDAQLKELYTYHRWVHSDVSKTHSQSLTLSPSLLKYIQSTLSWKPELGHALIKSLIPSKNVSVNKNFRSLQHVYTSCVNTLLDQLKEVDLDSDYKRQTADKIYQILSLFDPGPDISYLPIRQLLIKIFEVGKQYQYLKKNALLSVLIGHAGNKLVEEFCRIDYESEINNAVATYQSCAELTEEQRCLLHLSSLKETNTRWKMFFLLTLKKQRHLLEVVMETALSLIKCGMFEELQQLLSPWELQPLKPLLLLLGWTHCYSNAEARQLLETLWHEKAHCQHPAITMGCNKLAYQIDLIQWCIEKTKPATQMMSVSPYYQRAADLFKGLENHSVLFVLHQSTRLSTLDQQEVLDLLQKVPLQGDKEDSLGKKKTKSVRFEDDDTGLLAQDSPITSLDQKKDIAIYTGYCVLKNVMDAIMYCIECSDERVKRPVQSWSRRKINRLNSYSSTETDASGLSRYGSSEKLYSSVNRAEDSALADEGLMDIQGLYHKNVTEKLTSAKSYLQKMQPLTFRVEIMENLFSLLFLTHEDIQEGLLVSEYNSDEVDDKSFRSSTGTGIDSPSPQRQGSLAFELPKVDVEIVVDDPSSTAYDIPFEDVHVQKRTSLVGVDVEKVEQKLEKVKENISKSKEKLFNSKLEVQYERRRSSFSENVSSVSNCSNFSLDDFGFVVNEYLVRDILALLKDSILDLTAAKFQLYGNRQDSRERLKQGHEVKEGQSVDLDLEVEEPLSYIMKTSVSKEMLQKRITQLQKYTSEAQWRYQLVVNDLIPKQVGDVLKEQVVKTGDSSDEEVEIRGLTSQKSSKKRRRSVQDKQMSRQDLKEKVDHPYSDSSGGEIFKRQRLHSRLHSVNRRHIGSSRNKGVITLMLSAPVTLLTMSIRKGNFTQTKQIIKLCKLEERPEAMEVYFSQAFQKAFRSIQTITTSTTPTSPGQTGSRLSMKSLANVAAAGVANVSVSNIADELLSFPTLPKLPKLDKDVTIPQHIKLNFIPESVPVMILLDLMCTAGRSWEVCNHLMDSVKSRLPENFKGTSEVVSSADAVGTSASKKQKGSKIQTFADILTCLEKLLHLGADEQFPHQEPSALSKQLQKSISKYLNQAVYSLNSEKCKQYAVLSQNMSRYVEKVEEAFKQDKKQERDKNESSQRQRRDSTDSIRLRSGSSMDQPEIHHRMKQLIHVLEKEVPDGGLTSLMGRHPHINSNKNKNYLLSLYEHCRELAYLVSESETISRDSQVVPKNYFVMLEEGPIRILGRMMFNKKMPPARLEKVAKKLSLNLTHIIVYSCCVKVPSKRLPELCSAPHQNAVQIEHGKVIHNCVQGQTADDLKNPEEFVRNLLTRLVNLMKDVAGRCHAEGLFDCTCADMMVDMEEYNDIISKISGIHSADLLQLTKHQRRCFFGNLQTFMTIHCFMSHLKDMKKQREAQKDGHMIGVPFVLYSEMSMTDQITWLNTFAYRVGQLGVISLFELKYIINRCGLLPPSEWGRILEHRLLNLDYSDPWCQLAPSPDPQLLFAVTTCCVSSAPVQILEPNRVREQLNKALTNYLQTTVIVSKENRLAKLPELLLWHRRDFISDGQFTSVDYKSENEDLINFIVSQLDGDKERELLDLLGLDRIHEFAENINVHGKNELPFDIEVVPYNKDFLCVFDFESMSTGMKVHSSLNSSLTSQKSDPGETTLHSKELTYNMTPNTLDYIKADCPLVATLVSLVCSDDFDDVCIEEDLNEGHFGSLSVSDPDSILNRSRSPSAMSVVDIKSYRYEKLTYEYPFFKRHLLNYFVPLAATEDHDILKGDDPILKLLISDMMERFKSSILSLHESCEFRDLLSGLLNELFLLRKWTEILNIIHSIPVTIVRHNTNLLSLHDFVLCCSIYKKCNIVNECLTGTKSNEVTTLIHGILCSNTQARVILTVYKKLLVDNNIELFEMCLNQKDLNDSLREAVEQKFQEIKVFYRITECAKNLQIKLSLQSSEFITEEDRESMTKKHHILERFTNWYNVVEWTANSPREVLALLIKAGDFETAKSWCKLQKLSEDIRLEIEEHHVISLLNSQPRNTTKAFQILEQIKADNASVCLSMCQKFVEVFNKQHDILFISSYILNQLSSQLEDQQKDLLQLTHIGSRIMMFLPESMHIEYSHLIATPRFLLEQLIMNMKSELAGKAFQAVKQEYRLITNPELQFTDDQFNTLVALYAKKALEFTVVQYLDTGEKERTFSKMSVSSADKLETGGDSPLPRPVSDNVLQKRKSVDFQASTKPLLSLSQPGRSSPAQRMSSAVSSDKFVMPSEPPTRDQWVADSAATVCMVCKVERFSMFNRRHHCRRCGRVVCASCSGKTTLIRGVNARTCEDCYSQIVKQSDPERKEPAEDMYHQHRRLSGSALTPQRFTPDNLVSTVQEERQLSLSEVVSHTQAAWKLQTDDNYNANLREDFFFEQAPSTSLCISILNLHGNGRECGQLILRLCDDLSNLLKPIAPGVPNPEVDYSLIMSMMKYLLFHAKMKFIKTGENQGMARCDMYQSMVDLLGLLVTDNYRDLPSLQELTKMDSVRRLRDKLIEDERLMLAMEVSTKCGLDPTGVWVAMGMTCLQSGDFAGAREKFSKCLKPLKDKSACTPLPKLLNDIIDCLETMPGTGSMEIQLLLSTPGAMKNLISTPASTFFEEASMDSQQFQECLFYLRTYGSYLSVIDFHRRHGYYMKAVQYILDKKCSAEVFVEGLLKPSLESGELARLTDQMMMIDPSLEKWNNYLTAACRFFVKNRLHHVLYEFQLFMKDYIRAGITCYTYFYLQGAKSYIDLAKNIKYLFTAQQHMNAYQDQDPVQWGNVQHPLTVPQKQLSWERGSKSDAVSVRLVKSKEEVSRYIRTVALQIEVTKFLQTCLTSGAGEAASVATAYVDSSKLPTLFTNSQAKTDLAIMILLSGESIETSFSLAYRIITEYKLGAVGIFTHAAREMAKRRYYDQMRQIVDCVVKIGMGNDNVIDEIVGACLLVIADNPSEAKEADNIIKLLRKDQNKINAYILCGKLRSAYLMAVKDNSVDDVKRILRAANSLGQSAVINICNKWLAQFQKQK